MRLDHQPAGARRHAGAAHAEYQVAAAAAVAGVGDDRQIGLLLDDRYRRQVQGVAGVALPLAYGQNSPLAQDDILVSFGDDVFGEGEHLLDAGAEVPLEQDGLLLPRHLGEQVLIVHVPGAYLDYIGVLRGYVHLVLPPHLGDRGQLVLLAGVAQPAQRLGGVLLALGAQSLEGVDGAPRLEDASSEHLGAGLFNPFGYLEQGFLALHGAGAGDEYGLVAAYLDAPRLDMEELAVLLQILAVLPVDQLVGGLYHHGVLDPRQHGDVVERYPALVPNEPDDGAVFPLGNIRPQSVLLDLFYHRIYLFFGGVGLHYYHCFPPLLFSIPLYLSI